MAIHMLFIAFIACLCFALWVITSSSPSMSIGLLQLETCHANTSQDVVLAFELYIPAGNGQPCL